MDLKYLKSVGRYLISAILCLVLIAYIIYHLTGGLRVEIETAPATLVTAESTYVSGVTILRNEKLIYSTVNGDISYLYNDGEKVAMKTAVAEVYPQSGSEQVRQRIIEIDRAIRLLKNSNMSDSEKRTDTASTDAQIRKHLYKLLDAADKGDLSGADIISDDFLVQLNRRRIITKSIYDFNKQIVALEAEKKTLSSSLPQSESTIVTDSAGYFYTSLDGYENILSSSNISSMTYQEYLSAASAPAESYTMTINGYPIGKIVTDYLWYIACEVDISELHNYESGKTYSIKFPYNNDTSLTVELYRILSEAGSKTAVLIFETGNLPTNFSYLRHQTVQIVKESYTGYRIPVSAMRVENGKAGVYVLTGSKVQFKKVEPLYEYDGYVVVAERDESKSDYSKWLGKNDFIITKGTDLYDGKIIG